MAEIVAGGTGSLEITDGSAIIGGDEKNILAKYGEILQQDLKHVKLFQPDFKSRDKILGQVRSLTKTEPVDLATAIMEYGKWVATGQNILASLSRLEFRPDTKTILKWGVDPDIEAIQYFKLNHYAGRRSFLPSRYMNAGIKLDIHTTMLLLLGASLTLVGNRRIGTSNVAVHLSYQDPGARNLWESLGRFMADVGYQTEPLIIFRLATAFRLRVPAFQPIAIFEISLAGNKPALISYHTVELDHYLSRFVEALGADRFLENLMIFALRNWNESRRELRLVAQAAYNIALSIYLILTSSSVDSEGELFRIARYTYETTSDEFARALIHCRRSLYLSPQLSVDDAKSEFRRLLAKVVNALETTKGP
ncbi:hypothetical protein KEJ49_04580 [Candidatus Bathyarchaeota archaeon]|nr:hypothetical protein [Candidatus Bathyarchaeota archaeon]